MLQKIRDLMKTKEEIDIINRNIEQNSKITSDLKAELETLRIGLAENKKSQDEFLKNFREFQQTHG